MSSIAKPETFRAYLDDIVHTIEQGGTGGQSLADEYRWLEPSAFSRAQRGAGDGGGRTSSQRCNRCDGTGQGKSPGTRCGECGGAGSFAITDDRVGDQVVATERYRVKLRHAVREVAEARNRLLGALADLRDAAAMLEPRAMAPDPLARAIPHPADRGDLARAKAAQERRLARAQRSGDWSEVVG